MRNLSNEIVTQVNKNGVSYLQFKMLNSLGVKHAYVLKCEGFKLTQGQRSREEEEAIYKPICDAIDIDASTIVRPIQTHTDKSVCLDKVLERFLLKDVDAVITDKKDIALATTNADCILYLLYDKEKKVVANVHSGWKGSYQRIVEKTIDKMNEEYGCKPEDIIVCICPSIRKCCFEVDEDVKEMFADKFSFLDDINKYILNGYTDGKFYIDTVGINNRLLINKGIQEMNIYDSGICSFCNSDIVHSFRFEGKGYEYSSAIISL